MKNLLQGQVVILIALFLLSCSADQSVIQNLTSNWVFNQQGSSSSHSAVVPGVVHLDLLRNNLIQDPYYRDNEENVQWVENVTWVYTSHFNLASSSILLSDTVDMVFEGLDTHARVTLNGKSILTADNMFVKWTVNVKSLLKAKDNTLTITFIPAPKYDEEQAQKLKPLNLPADFDNTRLFSRKAAYHYMWDWGPRLVTAGIWRPVYLHAWNMSRIEDVNFRKIVLGEKTAKISTFISLTTSSKGQINAVLSNSKTGEIYWSQMLDITKVGQFEHSFEWTMQNPRLWWVRNFGEQYMYPMRLEISYKGVIIHKKDTQLGVRTIELVQEKDAIGQSFYFKINGRPVFAKGGNYIPPDLFMPRVTAKTYEDVLKNAIDGNYNFLRIWGGGNYESDVFYDICDREGILVWQDFMFANGMYPSYKDYLPSLTDEITQNVRRLANHPSIALWCGNNEIKNGWEDWGYSAYMTPAQRVLVAGWYDDIFNKLIPSILAESDPSRSYLSSSPIHGWGHPESYTEGDCHYYGVWVSNAPIENYTIYIGRFMSEYGMQGYPSLNTIKKFTLPEDRNISSPVIKAHEKGSNGFGHVNWYLEYYYRKASNFENHLYVSQIMQKYAIQTAVESHRYNKPRNMGTLLWQLNDVWPSLSWSSVDYYGEWKAVQYMIRKKYQDVIVSVYPSRDANGQTQYDVYIVSEKLFNFRGKLSITVMDFNGKVAYSLAQEVDVDPDSSKIFSTVTAERLKYLDLQKTFVYANLTYDFGEKYSDTVALFNKPKLLDLETPKIKVSVNILKQSLTLTSSTFVFGAYVHVNDMDIHFDDNYFDLIPNVPKTITATKMVLKFPSAFKIIHLESSYSSKATQITYEYVHDDLRREDVVQIQN